MLKKNERVNWAELKKEFFESKKTTAFSFFRDEKLWPKSRLSSGSFSAKIKGWTNEKKSALEAAANEAKERIRKEKETLLTNLGVTKYNLLIKLMKLINDKESDLTMSQLKDIRIAWEMIKTEMGEPTKIEKVQGDKENPLFSSTQDIINKFIADNPEEGEKLLKILDKMI